MDDGGGLARGREEYVDHHTLDWKWGEEWEEILQEDFSFFFGLLSIDCSRIFKNKYYTYLEIGILSKGKENR